MSHKHAVKEFIAGGFGGVCLTMMGHPLDTIKVRLQAMPHPAPGELPIYNGTLDCAQKTIVKEGVLGLYKGMAAPMIGAMPTAAVSFFGFGIGKKLQTPDADGRYSLPQLLAAGMLAGVVTTFFRVPIERVKCLLQIQGQSSGPPKYRGSWDCIHQLYRQGGVRGLYMGTGATLLRDLPGTGVYYMTYEYIKNVLRPKDSSSSDLSIGRTVFAGGIAGIVGWSLAMPPDVLKSRLQTAPQGRYPAGIRDVFRELIREEGFLALYRGIGPVLLRAFPANGACFFGYEIAMKLLDAIPGMASNS